MRLYHDTHAAEAILAEGFRDSTGRYLTDRDWTGVWVTDTPNDQERGEMSRLVVDVPEELLESYEWVEQGASWREWLVPADLLNEHGPPQLLP